MRAVVLEQYGAPGVLAVREVPDPPLERPTDVRVGVRAAAINPIDWKIRAGDQRGAVRLRLPWILGLDVAGVVLEVGPAVTRFAVGDEVLGSPDHRRRGSYAEQVVVDAAILAKKPPSLSFPEAAGLPLAGLTAWQCLVPWLEARANAGAPPRVLVQAGAGGVGHLAIQLAKRRGAWVAATCSASNADLVRGLGADEVIDYRTERWWERRPPFDAVLDAIGGEERERALRHVARGGRAASIVSGLPENTHAFGPNLGLVATGLGVAWFWLRGRARGVDAVTVVKRNLTDQLDALAAEAGQGAVRVHVDRAYPLAEAGQAHAYGETGRIRGKVVLVP